MNASGDFRAAAGIDREAGVVRITVSDNGAGMSAETLSDIFNLFVSTKGSRGTGLGLTVSRKILREHGGDIHASSRPGEGSTSPCMGLTKKPEGKSLKKSSNRLLRLMRELMGDSLKVVCAKHRLSV